MSIDRPASRIVVRFIANIVFVPLLWVDLFAVNRTDRHERAVDRAEAWLFDRPARLPSARARR